VHYPNSAKAGEYVALCRYFMELANAVPANPDAYY